METIKKNLEALLSVSASLVDGFTSLTIADIKKTNGNIDIKVHYKYYSDIEFDILLRLTQKNGEETFEIHHSSVLFSQISYHPDFIFETIMQNQRNELLMEKIKSVLELLQKGYTYLKTQFFNIKPSIENKLNTI